MIASSPILTQVPVWWIMDPKDICHWPNILAITTPATLLRCINLQALNAPVYFSYCCNFTFAEKNAVPLNGATPSLHTSSTLFERFIELTPKLVDATGVMLQQNINHATGWIVMWTEKWIFTVAAAMHIQESAKNKKGIWQQSHSFYLTVPSSYILCCCTSTSVITSGESFLLHFCDKVNNCTN